MCDARIVYLFQTVQTIFIGFQRLFLNKIYIPFYKSQTSSLTTNIHAKLSYFFHKEACDQIIQPQGTAYGFFFFDKYCTEISLMRESRKKSDSPTPSIGEVRKKFKE